MKAGWETKRLGEIIQLEYGKPLADSDRNPKGLYAAYGANGIKDRTDKFYKDAPSIIVGRKGSAGEVTLTEDKYWPLDVTFFVEFDRAKYELQYLYFLLLTLNLPSMAKGVKPGINRNDVYDLTVTTPDIEEQRRIVTLLDEAIADIATAKANAEKNLQNARDLFSSHLQSIFTTRGEDWVEKQLGDIGKVSMCKRIFKEQTTPTGDIPFYKIGTFGKQADAFIPAEIYHQFRQKYSFPNKGDVLVSAAGTVGRRVVYDGEDAYFQDSNIVWIANDQTKLLNHFLYHFYGSCDWNSTQGATISRLYNDNLRQIVIAFPQSLDEQNRIATQLDVTSEETNRLTDIYRQKLTALDDLKKSLLHQAFSGQL